MKAIRWYRGKMVSIKRLTPDQKAWLSTVKGFEKHKLKQILLKTK